MTRGSVGGGRLVHPLWLRLFVAIAVLLTTRVTFAEGPANAAGFWVNELPEPADGFAPCFDGQRAWIWWRDQPGIKLVDRFGHVIASDDKLVLGDKQVLGPNCKLIGQVSIREGKPGLTLFEARGSAVVPIASVPTSDGQVTVVGETERAWVANLFSSGEIQLLDFSLAQPVVRSWHIPKSLWGYSSLMDVTETGACIARIFAKARVGNNQDEGDLTLLNASHGRLTRVGATQLKWKDSPTVCAAVSNQFWFVGDTAHNSGAVVGADGTVRAHIDNLWIEQPRIRPMKNAAGYWLSRKDNGLVVIAPDGQDHLVAPKLAFSADLFPLAKTNRAVIVSYSGQLRLIDSNLGEVPIKAPPRMRGYGFNWSVRQEPFHPGEVWLTQKEDEYQAAHRHAGEVPEIAGTYVLNASGDPGFGGKLLFPGSEVSATADVPDSQLRVVLTFRPPGYRVMTHVIDALGNAVGPETLEHEIVASERRAGALWIPTRDHLQFMRPGADLTGANVTNDAASFECDLLGKKDCNATVNPNLPNFKLAAKLTWPEHTDRAKDATPNPKYTVELCTLDASGKISGVAARTSETVLGYEASWDRGIELGVRHALRVTYSDGLGSWVQIAPKLIIFRAPSVPLIERVWFRTGGAFLLALVALSILVRTRGAGASPTRWLPIGGWTATSIGSAALTKQLDAWHIDGTWLVTLLVGTLIAFVASGFFSPGILRVLAQIAPGDRLVRFALLISPRLRRRAYGEYLEKLKADLSAERREVAQGETYVTVPAIVREVSNDVPTVQVVDQPAEAIVARLLRRDAHGAARVLVEALGGTGKSALLRRIRELLLAEYDANPSSPIPIVAHGHAGGIVPLVTETLGRFAVSPDLIETHLQSGHFCLLIDGLSESGIESTSLSAFVLSEAGEHTPVLCSTRPSSAYRAALDADHRLARVEPRLDEATLPAFVRAYGGEDAKLSDSLLEVCRAPAGSTYLAVLVRLCLITGQHAVTSVGELYDHAFRRLLRAQGEVVDEADEAILSEAAAFCLQTYFKDGKRAHASLAFLNEKPEKRQLLEKLLTVGIVVPDRDSASLEKPRQVRFFHDSMQSYLAALGLFQAERWDALLEAAGAQRFVDVGRESELFRMCAEVFAPNTLLSSELSTSLSRASAAAFGKVARDDVLSALGPTLAPLVEQQVKHTGVDELITVAVRVCQDNDGDGRPRFLVDLVAALGPLLWRAQERATAAARV